MRDTYLEIIVQANFLSQNKLGEGEGEGEGARDEMTKNGRHACKIGRREQSVKQAGWKCLVISAKHI